jgi:hypothetical protein
MNDAQCVLLVAKVNFLVAFAKIATVYFDGCDVTWTFALTKWTTFFRFNVSLSIQTVRTFSANFLQFGHEKNTELIILFFSLAACDPR